MANNEVKIYAFEGLDGAGKTTAVGNIREWLEGGGLKVGIRRHPNTEGIVGKALIYGHKMGITTSPEMDKLFIYDLRRSLRQIPEDVDVMLWDRYLDSVYTSNAASNLVQIQHMAEDIRRPDRIFYLDLPPELAFKRAINISLHPLTLEWLVLKYKRYQELITCNPQKYIIVDATQGEKDVSNKIKEALINDVWKKTKALER